MLTCTFAWATGCVISITDDVADTGDDEAEDSGTEADEGESGSSSESTDDAETTDAETTDAETTDAETTDAETTDAETTDAETTDAETTDAETTDGETGGDECAPMDAQNGPEECFNPRGWFWNGETCEQIICTCEGTDCNALFPNEQACFDQYGECPAPPPPDCVPQEAEGVGLCELFLGWKWNGMECVPLSGCNCEGPDCGNLYDDLDPCILAHEECMFGADCAADEVVPEGDCDLFLGVMWTGDNCVGISGCECFGPDCDNLPLDAETCWDEHALCELGDPCEPDDAIGVGPCEAIVGWAWNGTECVGLNGCGCEGLDCDEVLLDHDLCEAAHAECQGGGACPGVMEAKGVGLCALFFGYAWNGLFCEGISGCDCEGVDCGNLYPDLDICELETAECQ
jgi:hypothetical protein